MAALGKLDDLLLRLVEASGHPMHAQNEWRHSMNRIPVTPSFYPSGQYVFTVSPGTAIGARTLVRRKVGWRKGIAIPQRGSAGRAFLRDKSRAPCQFLARTVNTYLRRAAARSAARRLPATECSVGAGPPLHAAGLSQRDNRYR